jgi:hypothetical protein
MGVLDKVPFLAGYNEQDQMNRAQENQGLMKLSQLMQMQKMQQDMQSYPEDRAMKRRLDQAHIGSYEASAAENQAKTQKMQELFGLAKTISALPDGHPEKAPLVQKYRMLADPTGAMDPTKVSPLAQARAEQAALRPDDTAGQTAYNNMIRKLSETPKQINPVVNVSAPVTPVTIQDPNNPNATIVIDGRTRQVLGAGPKLTETGRGIQKQMTASQGMGKDLQMAEDLLMGNVRDSEGNVTKGNAPTSSLIGKGTDFLGSVVGYAPSGAAEAKSLEVVGGRLVQKVPRFEGPQSDKDVSLYKSMAADVANAGLPLETRLASLRTMREIYQGYEDGSRGKIIQSALSGQQAPKQSGMVVPVSNEAMALTLPAGTRFKLPDGRTGTAR